MASEKYEAHAFHDDFPKGRSSGVIEIIGDTIRFEGGGKSVTMMVSGISLRLGGASDRLVYFNDPSQPAWTVYTSDRKVLKNPDLKEYPDLFIQMRNARAKHSGNWVLLITVAVCFLITPLLIYLSMDAITKVAANQVPSEWEASMGKAAFAQFSINHDLMDEELSGELLSPLTDNLIKSVGDSGYEYNIYIVNDESINAFALPGGYIVINSGLIIKADTAEEMQGVLAHEISHVTEKHGIRNIISTLGTYLLIDLFFGDATGVLAFIAESAPLLINQSYSRDFEREADKHGFDLLEKSDINPIGLRDFFFKIMEEQNKMLDKMSDENSRDLIEATFSVLSTHPATEERIEYIEVLISSDKADGQYEEFDRVFAKLKKEVGLFVTENDSNKSSEKESGDALDSTQDSTQDSTLEDKDSKQ